MLPITADPTLVWDFGAQIRRSGGNTPTASSSSTASARERGWSWEGQIRRDYRGAGVP